MSGRLVDHCVQACTSTGAVDPCSVAWMVYDVNWLTMAASGPWMPNSPSVPPAEGRIALANGENYVGVGPIVASLDPALVAAAVEAASATSWSMKAFITSGG